MNDENKFLLRNIGFGESFFDVIEPSHKVYFIRKEKLRKVASENAVIEAKIYNESRYHEAEDSVMYQEMDNCELYGANCEKKNQFYADSFINEVEIEEKEECQDHQEKEISNLNLFKNCAESQMKKLNLIVSDIQENKEEIVMVKAYKSKLKSKFYQIYKNNSKEYDEKIKYKLFHKCNYPSCGRTFASSGWLRSHFQEHLEQFKKNKFNIMFENFIVNNKHKYFN